MTKEELDRQIVDKKINEMSVLDGQIIFAHFMDGHASSMIIPQVVIDNLLKLNLVSKVNSYKRMDFATWVDIAVAPEGGYFLKLTKFGQLVRKKLGAK